MKCLGAVCLVFVLGGAPISYAFDFSGGATARKHGTVTEPLRRIFELYEAGKYADARVLIAQLSKPVQQDPEILTARGAVECQLGNYVDGLAAFKLALEKAPNSFWSTFNIAEIYLRQERWDDAEEIYAKLLGDPARGELVRFKIVMLNVLRGKPEEAQRIAGGFKFPSDTPAYYFAHAAIEFGGGNREAALDWIAEGERSFIGRVPTVYYRSFFWTGWLRVEDLEFPQEKK